MSVTSVENDHEALTMTVTAMTSHVLSWRSPSVPAMKKVIRPPARRSWSTTVAG